MVLVYGDSRPRFLPRGALMPVMIYDPVYEQQIRHAREAESPNARDEVWDGVLVMAPLPNIEH
jgi:hypothetical protein